MKPQTNRIFVTDCEGPLTKNDNAAELADAFIPKGDRLFPVISLYDDYLAEVVKRPGYKAGDTLRLILPFFKAFGLDDESMVEFSRRNIAMIPEADCILRQIEALVPAYIVSTSYSPYIKAVCNAMGFAYRNTYSTQVSLDKYPLKDDEKASLKDLAHEIVELPDFSIPSGAASSEDMSEMDGQTVARLDEIFWEVLPKMEIYGVVRDVNPIGGREKARAIEEIAAIERTRLSDVMYVGDSITDVDAFRLVRNHGGVAVSFNGNDWAVREAMFAVTARNALPIAWLATMFIIHGPEAFQDLLLSEVNDETETRISAISSRVRKTVRTEKIGSLG